MPHEGASSVAAAWLRKALNDLRSIEILGRDPDPPLDMLCFHAQQAAEKCLKALLAFRGVPFPRTHDLTVLVGLAGPDLGLAADDDDLVELSHLAVAPRYPFEIEEITREVADRAIRTARRVEALVRTALRTSGFPNP